MTASTSTEDVTSTTQPKATATVSTGGTGTTSSAAQCAKDFQKFFSNFQSCFPEAFNPDGTPKADANVNVDQLTPQQTSCLCAKSGDVLMATQDILIDCPVSLQQGLDVDKMKTFFNNCNKKNGAIKSSMSPAGLILGSALLG
ncbi:hypothetical protein HDU76_010169, partial [Blyttiomyces sp. JEL0837]